MAEAAYADLETWPQAVSDTRPSEITHGRPR